MEIQKTEWTGAQELLIKLVQILAPLAQGRGELKEGSGAAPFSKRLFIPPAPSESKNPFPYSARLLTTLHQAQKQMNHWIETLSVEESVSPPPARKKEPEAIPPSKGAETKRERAKETPLSSKEIPERRIPIQGQAQELILQVRAAIQNLSSFSNLEASKAISFREALKKLKPLIDDLIEAVGKGDMHSADDGNPPRNAVPIPARQQQLLRKQIPLPQTSWMREKPTPALKPKEFSFPSGGEKKRPPPPKFLERGGEKASAPTSLPDSSQKALREPNLDRPGPRSFSEPAQKQVPPLIREGSNPSPIPFHRQPPFPGSSFPTSGAKPLSSSEKEKDTPPFFDRTAIPGAPYSSQIPSSPSAKTKKKRKRVWTREEKDEDEDPLLRN